MNVETPYVSVDPWDPGLDADLAIASMGDVGQGLEGRTISWADVSSTGRPGVFYEYAGAQGAVSFTFNVEKLSDNETTQPLGNCRMAEVAVSSLPSVAGELIVRQ